MFIEFIGLHVLLTQRFSETRPSFLGGKYILFEKETLYQYDIFYQWYDLICDTIDSKLYKPPIIKEPKKAPKFVCPVYFINKGMDKIGLSKSMNIKEYFAKLPENFKMRKSV